jgi:hypothetical protein
MNLLYLIGILLLLCILGYPYAILVIASKQEGVIRLLGLGLAGLFVLVLLLAIVLYRTGIAKMQPFISKAGRVTTRMRRGMSGYMMGMMLEDDPGVHKAPLHSPNDQLEANKRIVREWHDLALNQRKPEEAVAKYHGLHYRQRNPGSADGPEPFIGFMKRFAQTRRPRYGGRGYLPLRLYADKGCQHPGEFTQLLTFYHVLRLTHAQSLPMIA